MAGVGGQGVGRVGDVQLVARGTHVTISGGNTCGGDHGCECVGVGVGVGSTNALGAGGGEAGGCTLMARAVLGIHRLPGGLFSLDGLLLVLLLTPPAVGCT